MKRWAFVFLLCGLCSVLGYTQGTTVGARYPEVAQLDVTADQDLGMTVAFKLAANSGYTKADTPGAYVAERLRALFQDAAVAHVSDEQLNRILEALKLRFSADDSATLNKVAMDLGVDIVVTPPPDKGK